MKRIILAAAILLGTFGLASAQNTASAGVSINGEVIKGITLTVSTATLNLGTMVAGTTPAAVSASTSPIMFTLTGNGSSSISVTYLPVSLIGSNGGSLTFASTVIGDSSSASQASAPSISSGASITLGGANYSVANFYFWLGGSVGSVPANQPPGSYDGTFTLSVAYN